MKVHLSPQTLPCILERIVERPSFRMNRAQREEKGRPEQASGCLQMELMWRLEGHIKKKKKTTSKASSSSVGEGTKLQGSHLACISLSKTFLCISITAFKNMSRLPRKQVPAQC